MRIQCPTCSATYDVPDPMLESGRKVRCGKCGQQWVASTAAPVVARAAPAPIPAIPTRPPQAAPDVTVAAPPRPVLPDPPAPAAPAPIPAIPDPAPLRVAAPVAHDPGPPPPSPEPPPAAAIEAEQRSASRHPLFALVGAEAGSARGAGAVTPAAADERPPPSVWDTLTEQPARPVPLAQPLSASATDALAEPPPARPRRSSATVWLGWLISLVIWGFVAWAAFAWRHQLMAAWPPIGRLYAAFGAGP